MWYALDLGILGLIALLLWRSLARGALRAAFAIARLALASVAGWAGCEAVRWCGGRTRIDVALWAICLGCVIGLGTLIALALYGAYRRAAWFVAWFDGPTVAGRAPSARRWRWSWLTAVYLLSWVIVANAVAASSAPVATAMRERSLVTRWLLSRRLAEPDDAGHAAGARPPEPTGIDALLAASGAGRTLTMLADMRALTAMSPEERERLIASSPPLQALVADDAMLAVIDDVHRLQLVDDACHGSFRAIRQLANDPAIAALADDASLKAALAALDPDTLARAIRACREAPGERVAWTTASAASSLQAAAVLKAIGAWSDAGGERLTWPRGTGCGLARTRLAISGADATLTLTSAEDALACWLDGREVAPRRSCRRRRALRSTRSTRSRCSARRRPRALILMVTPPLLRLCSRDRLATAAPPLSCRAVVRDAEAPIPRASPATPAAISAPARP